MKQKYYICSFKGKDNALALFSLLDENQYKKFQLIPTPCRIKAGCNYSIKFNNLNDLQTIQRMRKQLNISSPLVYIVEKIEGKSTYTELII